MTIILQSRSPRCRPRISISAEARFVAHGTLCISHSRSAVCLLYTSGKVYRGERAQRGRFREFYQADIDIIGDGKLSIVNEAEIPSIIYKKMCIRDRCRTMRM